MPAAAIIASRPLFSSAFCMPRSSVALLGLSPAGSKPRSPASWSERMVHGSPPNGELNEKT